MTDDCCAPQWVDFMASPQLPSDDYFDKNHEIHQPSKLFDASKKIDVQQVEVGSTIAMDSQEELQEDIRLLQKTPIKVVYQPAGSKREIIQKATYDDILQEVMNNLQLSARSIVPKKPEGKRPKVLVCQYRRQSLKSNRQNLSKSPCNKESKSKGDQISMRKSCLLGVNYNRPLKVSRSLNPVQKEGLKEEETKENCVPSTSCQINKQMKKNIIPKNVVPSAVINNGSEIIVKKEEVLFFGIPVHSNQKKATTPIPFSFETNRKQSKINRTPCSNSDIESNTNKKQEIRNCSKERRSKFTTPSAGDREKQRREFEERMRQRRALQEEKRRKEEEDRLNKEKMERAKLRKQAEVKARPMPIYKPMLFVKSSKPMTKPQSPAWTNRKQVT